MQQQNYLCVHTFSNDIYSHTHTDAAVTLNRSVNTFHYFVYRDCASSRLKKMVYIHFPSNLTEEELMLQAKYQKLKKKVGGRRNKGINLH